VPGLVVGKYIFLFKKHQPQGRISLLQLIKGCSSNNPSTYNRDVKTHGTKIRQKAIRMKRYFIGK
jgi:hypothetical protein